MNPRTPPSRVACTVTCILSICVPTDRHIHSFSSWGKGLRPGWEIWGQEAP